MSQQEKVALLPEVAEALRELSIAQTAKTIGVSLRTATEWRRNLPLSWVWLAMHPTARRAFCAAVARIEAAEATAGEVS